MGVATDRTRSEYPVVVEGDASAPSRTAELLRRVARVFIPLSRPLAGRRWFPLWGIVSHVGRNSGRAYATPLVTRRTVEGFVIPVPFGANTQWVKNVLAAGRCTIRWRGRDWPAGDPRIIDRATAAPAFGRVQRSLLRVSGLDRFVSVRDAD